MAKIIEITKSKVDKMSDLVEDMLLAGGELMHCLTKMEDEMYGERSHDGDRYRMNMRHHDHEPDWEDDGMYNERRRYRRMMR